MLNDHLWTTDDTRLLVARVRSALWIVLVSTFVFVLATPRPADTDGMVVLLGKLALAGVVGIGLSLIPLCTTRWRVVTVALLAILAICQTSALSGFLTHDAVTTPLLSVIVAMGAATLLPWGVGPQIGAALIGAGFAEWTHHVVVPLGSFGYTRLSLALGFGASVYIAYTAHYHRRRTAQHLRQLETTHHELAAARDHALDASRLKSEFLATISHEIRTPLNGIIGTADLLRETQLTVEQQEYATILRAASCSLVRIVNDILDFSRIDTGKLEVEAVDFNLPQLVQQVADLCAAPAREKGLALSCRVSDNVPLMVRGDAARLRQILANLLDNAIRFTEQGSVVLRGKLEAHTIAGSSIRFEVSDTGIGIAPEARVRLFEPFSQVDASTTRKYGGTGLGLAICHRLTELLGGEIGVDSIPDRGSTFWVTLPCAKASVPLAAAAIPPPPPPSPAQLPAGRPHDAGDDTPAARQTPLRARQSACCITATAPVPTAVLYDAVTTPPVILVAEDNRVNQLVAARLLQQLGYDVDVAWNGLAAVAAVAQRTYAAVLMDCQMPELDGFDATQQIRARERQCAGHLPIIAMTANAMPGDRERCLAVGMDDFIPKPVDLAGLREVLERFCAARLPFDSAGIARRTARAV